MGEGGKCAGGGGEREGKRDRNRQVWARARTTRTPQHTDALSCAKPRASAQVEKHKEELAQLSAMKTDAEKEEWVRRFTYDLDHLTHVRIARAHPAGTPYREGEAERLGVVHLAGEEETLLTFVPDICA